MTIGRANQPFACCGFSNSKTRLAAIIVLYGIMVGICPAQNWFPTDTPKLVWTSIALSSDGTKLFAASSDGYIFKSTNGSVSWMQTSAPFKTWSRIASSADGMKLVAGTTPNSLMYKSTDGGETWSPDLLLGTGSWSCLASSADGTVLAAGAYGKSLYVSTNSGLDWQSRIYGQNWGLVYCSWNGDVMMATGGDGLSVIISTNLGQAWLQATNLPAISWRSLAGSSNGVTLALASNSGKLFTSTNTGATWNSNSLPISTGPIALSGDAKTLTVGMAGAVWTSVICSSTNLGISWVTNNAPNNIITWSTVASSTDGTKLAAVGDSYFFVSPPPPTPKGNVVAWNRNNYGQTTVPIGVSNVVSIAGSANDSFAVRNDGVVLTWGYNGQTNVPADLTNVIAVAASSQLNLALKGDGNIGWWGVSSDTNIIPSLVDVVDVAASEGNFYLALQRDGLVKAWGINTYHQTNVPPSLSNVVAVAASSSHCVALKSDGTVAIWGAQTNIPPGLSNVVAIAAGDTYSLALKQDGTVVGWPTNEVNVVRLIPTGLSNFVSIAAKYKHALALTKDGNVWEWGTVETGFLKYQVGLSNIVAVACGTYHSLAITSEGAPSIVEQPWNQTRYRGFSSFMYGGAVGAPPLVYQWQLNGTNVDGATNALLNLTNIQPMDSGSYVLMVSNSLGVAVSSNAVLTVLTNPPTIVIQPTNQFVTMGSNITFSVAAGAGPIPNFYQWQFNGTNINGATNAVLALTNVQMTNQGNYAAVVNNGYGTDTSSNAYLTVLPDLPTALNTTGLTWTTSGSAVWFAQTNTSHDGFGAAQSGTIANSQSSTLQTTVTGPGTLTFWWMFSTSFLNTFSFSSSQSNNFVSINSTTGWQQKTFYLGVGQQTLAWNYSRSFSGSSTSTSWVDQVSFIPGGTLPTIISSPPDRHVRANSSVVFAVTAYGTPPLAYQWQLNGTNLLDKTNASLFLTSVQLTNSGTYSVIITNSFGAIATNAALWVEQFSLNTSPSNLFMSTNGFQLTIDGILTTNPVVIFGSTDLVNWLPLFTNSATTGSVQFLDFTATNTPLRFYRAQE